MHHVHAEKRAKSHCNCIGFKEFRGPLGEKECIRMSAITSSLFLFLTVI